MNLARFLKLFFSIFILTLFLVIFLNNLKSSEFNNLIKNNSKIDIDSAVKNPLQTSELQALTTNPTSSSIPTPIKTPITNIDYINFPISKTNSVSKYAPIDLVVLNPSLSTKKVQIRTIIVSDLTNLMNAAKADGVNLKVVSGYRSYADQNYIFNNYVQAELKANPTFTKDEAITKANTYSAKPGHSEHQLGTTVDILSDEVNYQFNSDPNTKFAKWLTSNAYKYNFKISYPQGNSEYIYEPWHLRWRNM